MKNKNKIWITGSNGMVGQAIKRFISKSQSYNILESTKEDFDQTNQYETKRWLEKNNPDTIIITSALVGGIQVNSKYPLDFLYQNSMIALNIINGANEINCKRLVFLGASCMYPKNSKQPFHESAILDGKIEKTNEGYGLAKILGTKLVEFMNIQHNRKYISIIPAASYGPNDCYDEKTNHVIPALIQKFHNAKINNNDSVEVWGSGKAKREFLHVDDMASGIIFLLENYFESSPVNLGTGEEVTIKELAKLISKVVDYKGQIIFDESKPDGIPRKILDSSKIQNLGWKPSISLFDGLEKTYHTYLDNFNK
jgi:GDP-L-fucose synthase